MSKMKDLWGDHIVVDTIDGLVDIAFAVIVNEKRKELDMVLDAALTRKLIKKLKKAIAEVEDV